MNDFAISPIFFHFVLSVIIIICIFLEILDLKLCCIKLALKGFKTRQNPLNPSRIDLTVIKLLLTALAGLLNSVSLSSTPLPPSTPQMNDLSALFNSLSPNQAINLGGIRSSSPITAVVAAANLLSGPPPSQYTYRQSIQQFVKIFTCWSNTYKFYILSCIIQ